MFEKKYESISVVVEKEKFEVEVGNEEKFSKFSKEINELKKINKLFK